MGKAKLNEEQVLLLRTWQKRSKGSRSTQAALAREMGISVGRLVAVLRSGVSAAQRCRVTLCQRLEGLSANSDRIFCGAHVVVESTQDAVVLQQMSQSVVVSEVVDAHNFNIGP